VTRDVDATFVPHGIVLEECGQAAQDLGLPRWWLNEQDSAYSQRPSTAAYPMANDPFISGKEDPCKCRVFDHPAPRVMAASPAHIFAMKARAARTRDIEVRRRRY
jgi:hypothetical protein